MNCEDKKAFIERLAKENRKFYGTPDGMGVLRSFDLTFEHRWLYLFELVQNALDAGAQRIAFRLTEDANALIFQHDGKQPFDEGAVKALSKVFLSTKGASTVGFMGIGFKSVFGRFREARISGWGWKFCYRIEQVTGEKYGDVQPDLLGAVVPLWDSLIPEPGSGFTTRFEMRLREGDEADLKDDFTHFLPDEDPTPLAILAASGLRRFEMDDRVWELESTEDSDGTLKAVALLGDKKCSWQMFPSCFQPTDEAIARFLEHRRINLSRLSENEREQVNAEVTRPRRVLGVLPLDDDGKPVPPARGRIYATLPTDVTLPFGLHIHADWLLNISRSGLREIENNAWQRDIVDRIADVLASFLRWVARTFSEPAAVKAAFSALAPPSSDARGLEALLAKKRWLSRLRDKLEDAAVLPVWKDEGDALAFVKPGDAIIPPASLVKAFKEHPDLRPAVLLEGPVLMNAVLGSRAYKLMDRAGLVAEMSPQDLEQAWSDGLERWWERLAGDQEHHRALLIRIWAAVAELTSEDAWADTELHCVRTVTEQWLPVGQIVFFNEEFPSDREPDEARARKFLQPFIPAENLLSSEWIEAVRRGAVNEGEYAQAKKWIDNFAKCMTLREVVGNALRDLEALNAPDWSVLAPFGHWARKRNRPDLLTRVLVENDSGLKGIPTAEALLAAPYVVGQNRRRLFPNKPTVSAAYLEQDPEQAGAEKWQAFLEAAGVKGKLEVREISERRRILPAELVAEFPHQYIDRANRDGYTLLDFDISPNLPEAGAPKEVWRTLAVWLDDGCEALIDKGRRKAEWHYHYPRDAYGSLSAWVIKLEALQWVPCKDGAFRRPQDVLPKSDPGREDAPVAALSARLLQILDQEGVKFGTEIPEATALCRLLAVGNDANAETLTQLLGDCREEIETPEDRRRLAETLQKLTVPAKDGKRVPLDRIVQRTGVRQRGGLRGWIVPLDDFEEALRTELEELEHLDFDIKFHNTTTGEQALAYIRDVWRRAREAPEGLANEVSDVLPTAYAYCLEDRASSPPFAKRWHETIPEASVFADREWVVLAGNNNIYFDDIDDRRFLPENMQVRTVTGRHLGRSRSAQIDTAKALGLALLSESIGTEWSFEGGTSSVNNGWGSKFDIICQLLQHVRGGEHVGNDGTGVETKPELKRVDELVLTVSVGDARAERVPIDAQLHKNVLTAAGSPVRFGADAAKELLRDFPPGQKANFAGPLTGMLSAIADPSDFDSAVAKFRRSFARDFELPETLQSEPSAGLEADPGEEPTRTANDRPDNEKTDRPIQSGPPSSPSIGPGHDKPGFPSDVPIAGVPVSRPNAPGQSGPAPTNDSYNKARAYALVNALAEKLKSALKGEIVQSDDGDGSDETARIDGNSDRDIGDEKYRKAAMQYEEKAGWKPELGDPKQEGWDIRSTNPETGEVRFIEVKGKGCPWKDDEVVELSRAQVRSAFKTLGEKKEAWYLYVVEKTGDGGYQVLPLENPVGVAAKWMLSGKSWRAVAEAEIRRDRSS